MFELMTILGKRVVMSYALNQNGEMAMAGIPSAQSNAERIARVVLEHATAISKQQEISSLVALNAALARDLVGAERCSLWLLDERAAQLWTKVAHGTEEIRIRTGIGIVGACIERGGSVVVNDVASDPRFFSGVDDSRGYHTQSIACVPLVAEGKVIGALQLLNKPGGFFEEDVELVRFVGMYAASVIHTERLRQEAEAARLLRHELDIAAEVQRKLFPQNSGASRSFEYSGFCRPAKFVSGDYYDFLDLPGGVFGLTVGDVAGKGIPAAVLMASIQMLLRNLLARHPLNLAEALGGLNEVIYRSSAAERYSTLFCGLFNPERSSLTYVNAGHIPPLIVRHANGHIDRPEGSGLPIGLLPSASYEQYTVDLGPGDLVVCVSDGVMEVVNPQGELWDNPPIEPVLRELREDSLGKITEQLVRTIDEYSAGSEQFDDITIVMARVRIARQKD